MNIEGWQHAGNKMTKSKLVDTVTRSFPGISKNDMMAVVDVLFEHITHALMKGEPVEIRGFGRFSLRKRSAIRARNPRSGSLVDVPERWAVHFKTSNKLKACVNE
jgi:integration host factor subunit beta